MLKWNKEESWFALDKQLHLLGGWIIAITTSLCLLNALAGLAAAIAAGLMKEIYDDSHPATHTASFKDWTATCIGGLIGAGFAGLLLYMKG